MAQEETEVSGTAAGRLLVTFVSVAGMLLGKGSVPGGMPTIFLCWCGALLMAGFAFFAPLVQNPGHVPLEWMLMAVWAALGLAFSRLAARS